MATLAELVAQKEALEQKISSMQSEARTEAIAQVRALITEHGLTAADVSGRAKSTGAGKASKKSVAVKYRDKNGNAWTGRGLKPKWLTAALTAGKKMEEFAV